MLSYYEMVYRDVKNWLEDEMEDNFIDGLVPVDAIDKVYDELSSDSYSDYVTGNASGSYYCDAYKAREDVLENICDVAKAYEDFELEKEFCRDLYAERWERMDVIAREAWLCQAVNDAVVDYIDNMDM